MPSIRQRLQDLCLADRRRYEALIDRFESDWCNHPNAPPDIAAHLPADEPLRTLALVALVKTDMESRRRQLAGGPGEYVGRFAELSRDAAAAAEIRAWQRELALGGTGEGAVPKTAGRNVLGAEIGGGGIGIVLRAYDPQLGRNLAVKILRKQHANNPAMVQRFLAEALVLGKLQHPAIVPVYDSGQLDDGRPWFSMRLVHGQTLAALLEARKQPGEDQPRFLTIFAQVCQALAYAHENGIIHRDLTPSNIMVGPFGEVQVMDWGLAKDRRLGGTPANEPFEGTTPGTVMGTPGFMAPEQARGDVDRVDVRSDVFSLGAVLCVVLTGKPPYVGRDRHEILHKSRDGALTEARERLSVCGADAQLVRLCQECLARRPADRPAGAAMVAARVAAYQTAVHEQLRQAEREQSVAEPKIVDVLAEVAADFRGTPDQRSEFGLKLHSMAMLLFDLGKPADAREIAQKAILAQRAALETSPGHPGYRQRWQSHCQLLAAIHLALGQHAEAVAIAADLPAIFPDNRAAYGPATSCCIRAMTFAANDEKLPMAQRKTAVDAYAGRAAKLLRLAVQNGFLDAAALISDAALVPLRGRAEFSELLRELESKPRK
jgi:Protein kinase domain/Tetratricopeptide repeat